MRKKYVFIISHSNNDCTYRNGLCVNGFPTMNNEATYIKHEVDIGQVMATATNVNMIDVDHQIVQYAVSNSITLKASGKPRPIILVLCQMFRRTS